MDHQFRDFPILSKVETSILALKKQGFPKYSGEEDVEIFVEKISNLLINEFGILLNMVQYFEQDEFKLPIFRVRPFDEFTNINIFREHSYPPIDKVGMGRCNFPKYPVFYCSNDATTALVEAVKIYGKNKLYCISKWEINPTAERFIFQTFLQAELPKENHFNVLRNNLINRINAGFGNKLDKERQAGLIAYLQFLHNSFITDTDYSLSASLAHISLFSGHTMATDILMYPSVQTRYKGVNMAIHPNFVENNMKIVRFYLVKLDSYDSKNGKMNVSYSKYAEDFGHLIKPGFKSSFTEITD